VNDIKGTLKGIAYTLTITADEDTITFIDDMLGRGREDMDNEPVRPPAMIDFDTNTVVWLNPTLQDAKELVEWVTDTVALAHEYGQPQAFCTVRYEHVEFGKGVCDCTACQEGWLDADYFKD
jgi:hypothetical protein